MDPLHDRSSVPGPAAFARAAGDRLPLWRRLVQWIASTYGIDGEPLWSGAEDGWALRFRRGGRALVTLVPRPGELRAVVVIGPSAWSAVQADQLSDAVRDAWAAARPYPDGRWLWLQVSDEAVVADIERLIAIKSPPPRRPRPSRHVARATVTG
jgi:hypothetical protein